MKRAKKKLFHDYITRKGLKSTRQRDVILDCFLSSERHMSIEELYLKLRAKHPNIGYATVYRTLKLFAEAGIANEIQFGDGQTRYEPATQRHSSAHDHLICTSCGEIVEFESDRISELQLQVARRHGFEIQQRRVELYGRCAACRRAGRERESAA